MYQIDSKVKVYVAVLVIIVAFAWIGYAFIVGTDSGRMVLHPIVPILFILLLLKFRKEDSVRYVIGITVMLISIWLLKRFNSVFMPFIIGFALAYIVNVAVSGLQSIPIPLPRGRKLHLSRAVAFIILIILVIALLSFIVLGIVPQLIKQSGAMRDGVVKFYNGVKDYTVKTLAGLEGGEYPFKNRLPRSWRPVVEGAMEKVGEYVQEKIPVTAKRASEIFGEILSHLSAGLMGTVGQISSVFFITIVFIYAVQSFQWHMRKVRDFLPEGYRYKITRYAVEIDKNMRSFLKGQLTVIVIISVISAIAYSIIRVPFAMLVGLLAGLCNAIPTIGPILGGAIAVFASLVGFAAGNYGVTGFLIQLALIIGVVIGIQLLDNSLISPKIMSNALDVHPLVVIFAVLISASLIGVWGAVLAIPGVVVFKAFFKVSGEIGEEEKMGDEGTETGAPE